jgi:hypothetical protein
MCIWQGCGKVRYFGIFCGAVPRNPGLVEKAPGLPVYHPHGLGYLSKGQCNSRRYTLFRMVFK